MDPVGSWAATNLTVHSSNSFLGPHFGTERPDPIRELHFLTFSVFSRFQTRGGYVDPVVSWRTQLWKIPW